MRREKEKEMKSIILSPTITITVEDSGQVIFNADWSGSLIEVYEDDEPREATDEERTFVDSVIPQIIQ
jgi:hypothetical protein